MIRFNRLSWLWGVLLASSASTVLAHGEERPEVTIKAQQLSDGLYVLFYACFAHHWENDFFVKK